MISHKWSDVLAWWGCESHSLSFAPHLSRLGHIQSDSRSLSEGDVFIALKGSRVHGVTFAPAAKVVGAWVISDRPGEGVDLLAPDLAQRLGDFLNWFYDYPSQQLALIGITGTNGKTSTSHYVAQWLSELGQSVALMGTVGNGLWGKLSTSTHTTPDAPSIYRQLSEWRDAGVQAVVMEVSSHAIDQQRIIGLSFSVLALTQVTRDHLDYHGTIDRYHSVKKRLFSEWHSSVQVLNMDDQVGTELASICPNVVAYSQQQDANVCCLQNTPLADGMAVSFKVERQLWQGLLPLYGSFNIENVLCALACVQGLGYQPQDVFALLTNTTSVVGRMQRVSRQPIVVVDYAHTPDALAKALQALRVHAGVAPLFVVFGAGGNRDKGKRPLMGAVAVLGADVVIVTDDNPRDERPSAIADDVFSGINKPNVARYIPDRQSAICTAIAEAGHTGLVLIAGKGHETYQEVAAGVRLQFSDSEAVKRCLA